MRFGPERGHFLFIFEHFFRDFGLLLGAGILYLLLRDTEILWQNSMLLILVLFAPVKRLIQYLCTRYSVDDKSFYVESGWLKKKKLEVPLASITTVDFTQGFIFRLAGVCSTEIDNSGSISGDASGKIKIVLKYPRAQELKDLLLKKKNQAQEAVSEPGICPKKAASKTVSVKEIFLMGLLRSKVLIVVQLITYTGIGISIFSKVFMEKNIDGEALLLHWLLDFSAPVFVGLVLAGLYLIGTAVSTLLSVIRYYGFCVTDRGDSIFIEYGLLTRKTHTLIKEKVSGISYSQPLLMRMFGWGILEIFAVGYGDGLEGDQTETSMFYPVLPKAGLDGFVQDFLPEVKGRAVPAGAPPRALPYFFLCLRFFFALAAFAASWFPWTQSAGLRICIVAGGFIFLAAAAGSVVLEYKNSAMAGDEKVIVLTGGSYTKTEVRLKTEKVEFAEERAGMRKRMKKGIISVRLGVLAPLGSGIHKVRNLEAETFENVRDRLLY